MWRRVARWYDDWDRELLAVLQQPELAAGLPPGWRRRFAFKVARLSPLDRKEVHHIALTYRGGVLWRALAKLCLVFSVAGLLFKFGVKPELSLLHALLAANAIGVMACLGLVSFWFNHEKYVRPGHKMLLHILGLGLLGGVYGGIVSFVFKGDSWANFLDVLPKLLNGTGVVLLIIVLPGFALAMIRSRHHALLTAQAQQEAEQARLARELSETQLRLLRAQIEPHFLFNTLGAVQQLAEDQAPRAAELTAHLIDFLRAGTGDMRREQVPLESEFRLVESYLRVMQVRMGARLRFSIDLPAALAQVPVPSMLVLTLAENAIKHGIEPSLWGGAIEVAAEADADAGTVRIRVRDSGVGMSDTPGNGMGLENVRHRLRLAYGDAASLQLSEAEPGLLAEITIPHAEKP